MAKKINNPLDDHFAGLPDLDAVFEDQPNEAFTAYELKQIEELSGKYPSIRKLSDRYALLFSEPDKEFYAALAFASKEISNNIFNGTLDVDNTKHKAMMSVLEKGGAYYKTLQVGREKSGSPEAENEIEGAAPKAPPIKKRISVEGRAGQAK